MKRFLLQTLRYWHTIKKLKPIQVLNRFTRKLPQRPYQTNFKSIGFLQHQALSSFISKPQRAKTGEEFEFIGKADIFRSPESWYSEAHGKLWLYNLHYFDDINSPLIGLPKNFAIEHMVTWIADNQLTKSIGWEPYPSSLRIVNWIKWLTKNPSAANEAILQSLAKQAEHLYRNIEWHLMANHLFTNAKALFFAGHFLRTNNSGSWYEKGLRIIRSQLREQVLPDGGNFELSPMYHRIQLEDLLDLINVAAQSAGSNKALTRDLTEWRHVAARMLDWSKLMSHPDGEVAFFNDSSMGIASSYVDLEEYAARLDVVPTARDHYSREVQITNLAASGFVCMSVGNTHLICDVGCVGPDYQPGHAHADTLSFELSINGQRALVNGGTSTYEIGKTRQKERGTANHNTVQIGHCNSSDVWSSHRVGLRANPVNLQVIAGDENAEVICEHNGYRYLADRPIHKREWFFEPGQLQIRDSVSSEKHRSVARIRIHPTLDLISVGEGSYHLVSQSGLAIARIEIIKGREKIEKSTYSPRFGLVQDTVTIAVTLERGESIVRITWRAYA